MYDAIIIGAGLGGLTCGAKLAKNGKKVLIMEKIHHIGGTSYIFKRKGFIFPMGALSFSYPHLTRQILLECGINDQFMFERSHFQLISPDMDIIYSKNWNSFREDILKQFMDDKAGINEFFDIISKLTETITNIHEWHPDYLLGKSKNFAKSNLYRHGKETQLIEKYDNISSKEVLERLISSDSLQRLLGSQGTYKSIMSMTHLAFMWNVMSFEGIWFPSCGIHGIADLLEESILKNGGEIKLNTEVDEVLIENGRVKGIRDKSGNIYKSERVISNADYKKTILELIPKSKIPESYANIVSETAYTGSELCVYLGIDPQKVDLTNLRVQHLFYRKKIVPNSENDVEDFENKEIEICLWSDKSPLFAPDDKKSLILRVNMSYSHFDRWRTGEKKRKEGYRDYKRRLANKLIKTVENIVPGLADAIEVMEIATPLTYRDWGQRTFGSVAGWTRDIKKISLDSKLLVDPPIQGLFSVGIYSVLEPFLGGVPVSMHTGKIVADNILELG